MNTNPYRFGLSTTVDYSVDIKTLFRLFAKYNFDFVSIGADVRHHHFPEKQKFADLIELAGEYDLSIDSVHVPFGHNYDLAEPSNSKRQRAVENVVRFLTYLAESNVPVGILHAHHYLKETKEKALLLATASLQKILDNKPDNIMISVENLPDARGSWIAEKLYNNFDRSEISFCYDSSHENMSGPPFHLLKKFYSRLGACHLSDNNGASDEHLVPGDGNIDWSQIAFYFKKAESFKNILFEVGTGKKLPVLVEDYIKRTAVIAGEIFGRG